MIDFNDFLQKITDWLNKAANAVVEFFKDPKTHILVFIENAKRYFSSLTQYETYAWIAEGVGFVLLITALILW